MLGAVRRLIAVTLVVLLCLNFMPSGARAQTQAGCADVVFEGAINLPIGGAVRRIIRLDADCQPILAPDQLIGAAELEFLIRAGQSSGQKEQVPSGRTSTSSGRVGLARPAPMVAGGPIHMFNRVKDAVGMNVTSIDPHNFSYGYNGSTITSTTHDSWVYRSTESGTCGPGWSIVWANTGISISGGGVGSSFADSLTHAEYSYQGQFDCGGTQYYNILDTKLTGYGSGASSTCAYRTQLRNTYFGWYQELLCWDAYVWTTPPPF